jgi:hypothetical protein
LHTDISTTSIPIDIDSYYIIVRYCFANNSEMISVGNGLTIFESICKDSSIFWWMGL